MVIDEGVFNGHQIWTECNLFFTINQQLGISFLQNLVYFLQPTKRDEKESEICNKSRWCGSATFSHCEDFFQNTRRSPSNNRSPAPKILQDLARSACPKIKYHHVPTAKINAVKQLKMMFKLWGRKCVTLNKWLIPVSNANGYYNRVSILGDAHFVFTCVLSFWHSFVYNHFMLQNTRYISHF